MYPNSSARIQRSTRKTMTNYPRKYAMRETRTPAMMCSDPFGYIRIALSNYTTVRFQRPRLNMSALATASSENAIMIAQNTPWAPSPKRVLSR